MGIVPEYFEKYYNTAVNVYCFGTSLAVIVSPLLTTMFLDKYGWRGAILMLCGLNLHSVPFGGFLKHNTSEKLKQSKKNTPLPSGTQNATHEESSKMRLSSSILKKFDIMLLTSVPFVARVMVPALVCGYTFGGWLIYIVSYALSHGSSIKEASFVSTCGGIGLAIIRIVMPFLSNIITYRQLLYISSFTMAIALALTTVFHTVAALCVTSLVYGMCHGVFGTQIYIAARDVTKEEQYVNAISWYHLVFGFSIVIGTTVTGK